MIAYNHLPVIDGHGRYLDTIFIERFWRFLKQEAVYLHELTNGFVAERVISEWITFYNTLSLGLQADHCLAMDRPHTALENRTPEEAYFDGRELMKVA